MRAGLRGTILNCISSQRRCTCRGQDNNAGGQLSQGVSLNADTNNVNAVASFGVDIGIVNTESINPSLLPTVGIEVLSLAKVREDYRLVTSSIGLQAMF